MNKDEIKVGDLVEDCSLMPGVVMKVNGRDIEVRRLDFNNEQYNNGIWNGFSCCSLDHCGVVKITPEQAKQRLILGKEKLAELWGRDWGETWEGYQKLIEQEISYE